MAMANNKLIETLIQHTELPTELLERELAQLLVSAKVSAADMNLESLRLIMADYLRDVFVKAKVEMAVEE